MNENNPWLEITKQNEVIGPIKFFVEGVEYPDYESLREAGYRIWNQEDKREQPFDWLLGLFDSDLKSTRHGSVEKHPLTLEDCLELEYDDNETLIAETIITKFTDVPAVQFDEYLDEVGFTPSEQDIILDFLQAYNDDEIIHTTDLLDFIYEENIWS